MKKNSIDKVKETVEKNETEEIVNENETEKNIDYSILDFRFLLYVFLIVQSRLQQGPERNEIIKKLALQPLPHNLKID
jgi:ribosomal protein S6